MTLPTSLWPQIALVLVVAVPSVAILTKLIVWLVYCFKAPAHRSGSEEMDLADQAELARQGKAPYTSYEEWRKDVLSDKPLDQILGRVPEDFFKRHEQELKNPKHAGAQGAQAAVMAQLAQTAAILGAQGPQGAQAQIFARQRLAEIQARMTAEKDGQVRAQMEAMRGVFLSPIGGWAGSNGSAGQPGGGNPAHMGYPGAAGMGYYGVGPVKRGNRSCAKCYGTGLVYDRDRILSGLPNEPCPNCK